MKIGRMKRLLVAFVSAAMPLVTTATCNPNTGAFDFFRDDGSGHWEDDAVLYQEDTFYYDDPYYYGDPYYNDGFFFNDCSFCF